MSSNRPWDGTYATSKEAQQSLEQDILDAGRGVFTTELPDGGMMKQSDHGINVYRPSDIPGAQHDDIFYNADKNSYGISTKY